MVYMHLLNACRPVVLTLHPARPAGQSQPCKQVTPALADRIRTLVTVFVVCIQSVSNKVERANKDIHGVYFFYN